MSLAQDRAKPARRDRARPPDVVLLDIGLPDLDGFEVLRQIRAFSDVPVADAHRPRRLDDKVKGLELGADDYVTKPFNHLELMARVKAVLRRLEMPAAREPRALVPVG